VSAVTDVVGYAYRADTYCPYCIAGVMDAYGLWTPPEAGEERLDELLSRASGSLGIDRFHESSYDSDDFPKVVFRDQAANDRCCECGKRLTDIPSGVGA